MNEVVVELAKKHPTLLCLQVEAEEQSDIAESFDIEAVPAFVILQGHTLLDRITGADAAALTSAISKHITTKAYGAPLSHTDKAPHAPSTADIDMDREEEKEETPEELNTRMQKLMTQSKVVLFMKGNPDNPRCGFSRKIVAALRSEEVDFSSFDILQDENVRQGLKKLNDWPTFPQLIVNGEFVGGLDIVQEMVDNGELKETLGA